jgi:hypothetical protein
MIETIREAFKNLKLAAQMVADIRVIIERLDALKKELDGIKTVTSNTSALVESIRKKIDSLRLPFG